MIICINFFIFIHIFNHISTKGNPLYLFAKLIKGSLRGDQLRLLMQLDDKRKDFFETRVYVKFSRGFARQEMSNKCLTVLRAG